MGLRDGCLMDCATTVPDHKPRPSERWISNPTKTRKKKRGEKNRKCSVGSMAPPVQRRRDACTRWPRMSSTFWAVLLLTALLLLYCGQLAAGTCEIVTLDRDSSQPRRTIARQTARCACKKGQIAGTTRARPACVDAGIVRKKQWCEMVPCLEDEGCDLLVNKSGWTCTQPGGRVKTTTVS
ncbi:chemokine-like protein TAFA-5a [Kryptolebias marmoratus]|uniref:chemokine-like protein TAFA-5a n=1 Tax=Kryptolebias marmoratus TaxID=37003 RepID=UPI0007F92DAC|nr:chemokine-like protein TAFA-5a [Kryptolebias marmoratus]